MPRLGLSTRKSKLKQITSTWMTSCFLRQQTRVWIKSHLYCWSHIRVNKRGAIIRVAKVVKIFEFEIWGRLKGRHLETKSPNTLKFATTTLCNLNRSHIRTQWNHKSKQHSKQVCNARCKTTQKRTLIARKESQNQNNFDNNRRTL
jgi:hypothetical protein